MESFLIYILKSSGILFIFWIIFTTTLKKDTFFKSHRLYLISGIIISTFLPLLKFTKTVVISPSLYLNFTEVSNDISNNNGVSSINWLLILFSIYILGVLLFSARILIQFISLKRIVNKCTVISDGEYSIAETNENINPFSFFNTIVINPELYSIEDYNSILVHEKAHASQKHSIDMLLAQLICIYQWMNPFVWLYKKNISQNLEFITDAESINILEDKKAYQYLLLNQTCQYYQKNSITNTFYNSLIKKRIVMLNQQKSNQINLLKYAIIAPLLIVFIVFFNTKTIAQTQKSNWVLSHGVATNNYEIFITKNTTDEHLNKEISVLKEKFTIDLKFSKVKRNSKGEITAIKASFKTSNGKNGVYSVSSSEPIKDFVFSVILNDNQEPENISFKESSSNSLITQSSSVTIKNNTKKFVFETDDIENDSRIKNIDPNTIKSMNIIKNDTGKGGTIEIELKNNYQEISNTNISVSGDKPLTVINGKVQDKDFDINTISPEKIESINIIKNDNAISTYGENAKNGAIEITLKEK
jgi:hypothetical protein